MREFLDHVESDVFTGKVRHRFIIDEPCSSYEEVIKDFFAQILQLPPEEAIVALWTLALYFAFSTIESHYSDKFAGLFQEID